MKRVLITGGAGSVGAELAGALVTHGDAVRVFDLPICDFGRLQSLPSVEIVTGDITAADTLRAAVRGVDTVVHLAALLPPASERSRERTFEVNAGGTRNLLNAILAEGRAARLIFASSVATYGDTTAGEPPIRVGHPQRPIDIYGESKVESEKAILGSGVPYTILRISGIAIPAFLEPPDPWPFTPQQRLEFVCRADVIRALFAAVQQDRAADKVLNIAGGPSWRMLGQGYAGAWCRVLEIPEDEATYQDGPGWCDWYDTEEAQALLGYQQTSFPQFVQQLEQAVAEALG